VTWIVGIPGLVFGAVGVGDVRITLQTATGSAPLESVGVQKFHAIAPFVALGFAGSIELGFRAVNDFRGYVGEVPDGHMVYPGLITWHWARRVRYVFNHRLSEEEKRGGLELLVLGASPGAEAFPTHTHGYILRGPEFELEVIPAAKAGSIGSGSGVPSLVEELEGLLASPEDLYGILQFAVPRSANMVLPVSLALTEAIQGAGDDTIRAPPPLLRESWRNSHRHERDGVPNSRNSRVSRHAADREDAR
jgi:hypothetical protein